jgi:prepilin-type N-terminal cleavage/methylation domain-containing protein
MTNANLKIVDDQLAVLRHRAVAGLECVVGAEVLDPDLFYAPGGAAMSRLAPTGSALSGWPKSVAELAVYLESNPSINCIGFDGDWTVDCFRGHAPGWLAFVTGPDQHLILGMDCVDGVPDAEGTVVSFSRSGFTVTKFGCIARFHYDRRPPVRSGFTLIELLVVITIIGIVVAVSAAVWQSFGHQSDAAGRLLHGALVGARDEAMRTGAPAGIRLLPDPTLITFEPPFLADGVTPNPLAGQIDPNKILAYDRIIPIAAAPNYSEGSLSIFTDGQGGSSNYADSIRTVNGQVGVPCLVLEACPQDAHGAPKPPTSWFWNLRVGDRIQISNAGPWYTIIGPMVVRPTNANPSGNSEMFVNAGKPGTTSPLLSTSTGQPVEYLLLVNGRDDNADGFVDNGFDGVDNNGNGLIDELLEWQAYSVTVTEQTGTHVLSYGPEAERWLGSIGP